MRIDNNHYSFHDQRWKYERCKHCGVDNHIGFQAPDDLWDAVVRGEYRVLCLNCFLHLAYMRGVQITESDIALHIMFDEVPEGYFCPKCLGVSIREDT